MKEIQLQRVAPADIEARSMELIAQELGERVFPADQLPVVKRVIHTTADFEYADNLVFSPGAVEKGIAAMKAGCTIVTDTQMAFSGVNKRVLEKFGGRAMCFMSDPDVAAEARERGETRATVSMERAAALDGPLVLAIGNAPTALVRACQLMDEGKMKPALVIGVPVGFVNVVESKELLLTMDVPYIVARGRKGGSNVAAAICNALLYQASNNAREAATGRPCKGIDLRPILHISSPQEEQPWTDKPSWRCPSAPAILTPWKRPLPPSRRSWPPPSRSEPSAGPSPAA